MTVVKIKKQKAEKSVWHTLQSGPGPWPSEKANTGPLQKVDSIPKLAVWVKIHLWQIWGCWIQVWQYFLKILYQIKYTQISHFWSQIQVFSFQNLSIFIISRNIPIRQIRRCWFQIWQYYFQIPVQKYTNKAFVVPNFGIFFFSYNFAIWQIWGCWFQIWQYLSKILAQNYKNKTFLVPNLDIFIFSRNFAIWQIQECWFQI